MREPPKFATDSRIWAYTQEKIKGQTGRIYESWVGKDFAAATVVYRNVLKKYGSGANIPEVGLECPRCEEVKPFPEGDYLCVDCRFGKVID